MGHQTAVDEHLLAEAARWHARLEARDCTDFERAQFQRWRAISRRHADAYESASGFSQWLERVAEFDGTLRAMTDEAVAMGAGDDTMRETVHDGRIAWRSPQTRRWLVPAALAAAIVFAVVGMRIGGYFSAAAEPVTYASSGQVRRDVTLADGSLVHLDVDSEIRVNFSSDRRDITLANGRALFEVSHDASRPFVVSAGTTRTTAVGTHFQVERESQSVRITLTEGSVAVTGESVHSNWSETLSPGEQISLSADDGHVHEKRAVDTQAVTSWSRGRLVFRSTPLAEALQEVNRYGRRKVRLGDADLAELPVDGNFIAGETDLIVSAFAAALPLRIAQADVGEIILFRRYEADVP